MEIKFPCYIGPWLKDAKLHQDHYANQWLRALRVGDKFYWFDLIDETTDEKFDYDDRIKEVRWQINHHDNRKDETDLPMVRVEDMGEFMTEQKYYYDQGHDGVIYFNAYSADSQYGTIMFKRGKDE